jgi:hypothetical protein
MVAVREATGAKLIQTTQQHQKTHECPHMLGFRDKLCGPL